VFGKARAKTVDRVAVEEDCDVVLTPGRAETVEGVFVPLRGAENADRILSFVAELLAATDASVTLFHADEADEQSDRESGEQLLADATDRLVAAGVDPDRIDRRRSTGEPGASIVEAGEAFDVLVLGETEPSLRDRILGALPARVTADTEDPTFVVRDVGES
jgi:nucleotide-binding universal stress UspA family protein